MRTSTIRNLFRLVRSEGACRTLASVAHHMRERLYDRRFGIHTLECIGPESLDVANGDSNAYVPTRWSDFKHFLCRVPTIQRNDVFVDYGCGMGRVLIMAAIYPFARVVGVEMSPRLSKIALANLQVVRPRLLCKHVEVVNCDAAQFVFPDDASVVYFFNPFAGQTLGHVLANIAASLRRAYRTIYLVLRGI